MKTGNVSMSVDGSSYSFNFTTSGGVGGRGADIINDEVTFYISNDLRSLVGVDSVVYNAGKTSETNIKYYDLTDKDVYLIGTNGKLKTKANGVKDGEDWYFFTDSNGKVLYYADDKNVEKALDQKDAQN